MPAVSEADRSKPDPDQPWRYVCPRCERQVFRNKGGYVYRCNQCEQSYEKDELKDLKN